MHIHMHTRTGASVCHVRHMVVCLCVQVGGYIDRVGGSTKSRLLELDRLYSMIDCMRPQLEARECTDVLCVILYTV